MGLADKVLRKGCYLTLYISFNFLVGQNSKMAKFAYFAFVIKKQTVKGLVTSQLTSD